MIIGIVAMRALIVAVDEESGIGKQGDIPWYFTEDMKYFSQTTRGGICIMGRKTYQDIINKMGVDKVRERNMLLPKRVCIVITSLPQEQVHGATAVNGFQEALGAVPEGYDLFFTGGASIYRDCLPFIDTALITKVPGTHDCDVTIPEVVNHVTNNFALVEETKSESGLVFTKYNRN